MARKRLAENELTQDNYNVIDDDEKEDVSLVRARGAEPKSFLARSAENSPSRLKKRSRNDSRHLPWFVRTSIFLL